MRKLDEPGASRALLVNFDLELAARINKEAAAKHVSCAQHVQDIVTLYYALRDQCRG